MLRILLIIVSCILIIAPAGAFGGPAPEKPAVVLGDTYLIDDFENGNLRTPREWWTFDLSVAKADPNAGLTGGDPVNVGEYSLHLKGEAKNWYAGGAGAYIAKEATDLSKFNTIEMDIYGRGEGSGTLKVELFDDDNNNWQVEQDPSKSYAATDDDKLVYDVVVDWSGWQKVSIPLADFVDDNPKVGDDVWNPQQKGDSGGLLQIQFVTLSSADSGMVDLNVDNIILTTEEE